MPAANTSGPRYRGQFYDAATDQVYLRNRYYSPGLGRFTSWDPIGYSGGLNTYNYAGSDPVNRWDPMGLDWEVRYRGMKLSGWKNRADANSQAVRLQQIIQKLGGDPMDVAAYDLGDGVASVGPYVTPRQAIEGGRLVGGGDSVFAVMAKGLQEQGGVASEGFLLAGQVYAVSVAALPFAIVYAPAAANYVLAQGTLAAEKASMEAALATLRYEAAKTAVTNTLVAKIGATGTAILYIGMEVVGWSPTPAYAGQGSAARGYVNRSSPRAQSATSRNFNAEYDPNINPNTFNMAASSGGGASRAGGAGPAITGTPPPSSRVPISMDTAIEQALEHVGGSGRMTDTGGRFQFISNTTNANGDTVLKIARFDINPNLPHVQAMGPHLNLETQVNGVSVRTGPFADPHTPIDALTVRPGDYP